MSKLVNSQSFFCMFISWCLTALTPRLTLMLFLTSPFPGNYWTARIARCQNSDPKSISKFLITQHCTPKGYQLKSYFCHSTFKNQVQSWNSPVTMNLIHEHPLPQHCTPQGSQHQCYFSYSSFRNHVNDGNSLVTMIWIRERHPWTPFITTLHSMGSQLRATSVIRLLKIM